MCIRPEHKNALIRWKKGLVKKEEGGKGRKIAVDGGQIHPEGNAGNVSTFIGICVTSFTTSVVVTSAFRLRLNTFCFYVI